MLKKSVVQSKVNNVSSQVKKSMAAAASALSAVSEYSS